MWILVVVNTRGYADSLFFITFLRFHSCEPLLFFLLSFFVFIRVNRCFFSFHSFIHNFITSGGKRPRLTSNVRATLDLRATTGQTTTRLRTFANLQIRVNALEEMGVLLRREAQTTIICAAVNMLNPLQELCDYILNTPLLQADTHAAAASLLRVADLLGETCLSARGQNVIGHGTKRARELYQVLDCMRDIQIESRELAPAAYCDFVWKLRWYCGCWQQQVRILSEVDRHTTTKYEAVLAKLREDNTQPIPVDLRLSFLLSERIWYTGIMQLQDTSNGFDPTSQGGAVDPRSQEPFAVGMELDDVVEGLLCATGFSSDGTDSDSDSRVSVQVDGRTTYQVMLSGGRHPYSDSD